MTLKRTQVVMLPTNEKASLYLGRISSQLHYKSLDKIWIDNSIVKFYNLYFLSDEEIKEGDWVYDVYINKIIRCNKELFTIKHTKQYKKIIATTDSSLIIKHHPQGQSMYLLPQPSQSFLERFVESYNKGQQIKEVMVEYEQVRVYEQDAVDAGMITHTLKIDLKDNTITIKRMKDSWNREEVINLIKTASKEARTVYSYFDVNGIDKWIEQNL